MNDLELQYKNRCYKCFLNAINVNNNLLVKT